jgi:hypothetical protein
MTSLASMALRHKVNSMIRLGPPAGNFWGVLAGTLGAGLERSTLAACAPPAQNARTNQRAMQRLVVVIGMTGNEDRRLSACPRAASRS